MYWYTDTTNILSGAWERVHGAESLAKVVDRMAPFGSKCTAVKEVPEKGRFKFENKAFEGFIAGYYPDGSVRVGSFWVVLREGGRVTV